MKKIYVPFLGQEQYFVFSTLGLFVGFVSGNLCPGFLPFLGCFGLIWPGMFITLALLFFEMINCLYFRAHNAALWLKSLNFYKMGFLLGLFTDAFKVGS